MLPVTKDVICHQCQSAPLSGSESLPMDPSCLIALTPVPEFFQKSFSCTSLLDEVLRLTVKFCDSHSSVPAAVPSGKIHKSCYPL
ncbi:hypothetical protein CDAR_231041 [Caerostris darwini]|uniref:Uncharacterized protein n=1 Tax=Caerostris darwini TaxID=1538125 RepID=A0AAV4S3Q3_9ARAC|nr:hypothetical protein CDAR_231041 [Caerostris darwini]